MKSGLAACVVLASLVAVDAESASLLGIRIQGEGGSAGAAQDLAARGWRDPAYSLRGVALRAGVSPSGETRLELVLERLASGNTSWQRWLSRVERSADAGRAPAQGLWLELRDRAAGVSRRLRCHACRPMAVEEALVPIDGDGQVLVEQLVLAVASRGVSSETTRLDGRIDSEVSRLDAADSATAQWGRPPATCAIWQDHLGRQVACQAVRIDGVREQLEGARSELGVQATLLEERLQTAIDAGDTALQAQLEDQKAELTIQAASVGVRIYEAIAAGDAALQAQLDEQRSEIEARAALVEERRKEAIEQGDEALQPQLNALKAALAFQAAIVRARLTRAMADGDAALRAQLEAQRNELAAQAALVEERIQAAIDAGDFALRGQLEEQKTEIAAQSAETEQRLSKAIQEGDAALQAQLNEQVAALTARRAEVEQRRLRALQDGDQALQAQLNEQKDQIEAAFQLLAGAGQGSPGQVQPPEVDAGLCWPVGGPPPRTSPGHRPPHELAALMLWTRELASQAQELSGSLLRTQARARALRLGGASAPALLQRWWVATAPGGISIDAAGVVTGCPDAPPDSGNLAASPGFVLALHDLLQAAGADLSPLDLSIALRVRHWLRAEPVSVAAPDGESRSGIKFENGAILGDSSGNGALGLADYDFESSLARFFAAP